MESIKFELDKYREYMKGKTSSKNILTEHCKATRRFLEQYPEAMYLDALAVRALIDGSPLSHHKRYRAS